MAASVQELILAAQAKQKKSPLSMLADLVNAGSEGYSQGVQLGNVKAGTDQKRAEILKTLIETQQAQQDMQAQQDLRNQFQQKIALQSEQNLRQGQSSVAGTPPAMTPAGKFEQTWSQDATGRVARSLKEVSPPTPNVPIGYRTNAAGNLEYIPGGPADPANKGNTTKPPPGFRWTAAGDLESIPGGPADVKAQTEKAKADINLANQTDKAQNVLDTIHEAIPLVSKWSAGFGSVLKNVPTSEANALQAKIQTITSNLGIDQLTAMKELSKTGASGFGQLSDRELSVITSAVTNLNQSQKPEEIVKNLKKLETHYTNWLSLQKGINPYASNPGGQSPDNPNTPTLPTINSQAEYDALPSGSEYMDSHGTKAKKK